jgi:hypothetical protein
MGAPLATRHVLVLRLRSLPRNRELAQHKSVTSSRSCLPTTIGCEFKPLDRNACCLSDVPWPLGTGVPAGHTDDCDSTHPRQLTRCSAPTCCGSMPHARPS